MKTINKIFSVALTLALGVSVSSCTDENDWSVDSAFDRLFGVSADGISVETTATNATVTFKPMEGAEYYLIEISKDSLYDEVAMGGPNALVFGHEKDIVKSPVVLENLEGDTKYYLRMKSMADGKNESRWVYYRDGQTFKTQAEQIFNEVAAADRQESSIRLTWTPGAEGVTNIVRMNTKSDGTKDSISVELSDEDKQKCEYTYTGLTPSTTYTFVIYNGEKKRGTLSVTTAAAMPDGDYKTQLSENTTAITQETLDSLVAKAQAATGLTNLGITIGVPAGKTIDIAGVDEKTGDATSLAVPDGISVTFFGLAGDKPVLNMPKSLEIGGSHSYIRFENVDIVDGGCQYIFNQSKACSVGEISFKGVNITGLSRSLVRLQSDDTKTVSNIIIDDCQITDQGKGNYALLLFKDKSETVENVKVSNSTFVNLQHNFIQSNGSTGSTNITVEACTFYNIIGSGRYFIDGGDDNITVQNCIFAKTATDSSKGIRNDDGSVEIISVYFTSDFVLSSNKFEADLPNTPVSSEELFEDPENGNFTVKDEELSVLGDPRWRTSDN